MSSVGTTVHLSYACFAAEALSRMAKRLGLDELARDRASLLRAIETVAGTAAHRAILERELSEQEWEILSLRLWELGPQNLSALHSYLSPDNGADGWQQLAHLFSLACFVNDVGPYGYGSVQNDPHALARRASSDFWYREANVERWAEERRSGRAAATRPPLAPNAPPVAVAANGLAALQRTIYIILTEAGRKPIRLKPDYRVYEADIARLSQAFAGGGARPNRGESAPEPPVLWFALGAVIRAKLLEDAGQGQGLRPARGAMDFLVGPALQQAKTLLNAWSQSAYDDFGPLKHLVSRHSQDDARPWIDNVSYRRVGQDTLNRARVYLWRALGWALQGDAESWYALDDFAQFAFSQYPDFLFNFHNNNEPWLPGSPPEEARRPRLYPLTMRGPDDSGESDHKAIYRNSGWRDVEGEFVREIFRRALHWLGIVEVGPDLERTEAFRLTDVGRHLLFGTPFPEGADQDASSPATLIAVQPNFEIVVPNAGANFGLLAELDQFAERRTVDRAATFTLTQAAFVHALDGRWTLDTVVATLEGASRSPLPQNVRFSLGEWAALHARLTLRTEAAVLRADRPVIDAWLADKTLGPLLGARLGPDNIFVPSANLDAVRKKMKMLEDRRYFLGKEPMSFIDYLGKPDGVRITPPDTLRLPAVYQEPHAEYRLRGMAIEAGRDAEGISYTVTRESVRHGLELGWRGVEQVQFLREASRSPVPIETRLRILGWSGGVKATRGAMVAVGIEGGDATWMDLCEIAAIAGLVVAVPSPGVALVEPGRMDALAALLAEYGVAIRDGSISIAQGTTGVAELREVVKRYKNDPEALLDAIRAAGMLGKLDRARGYY